ncbi:MAG: pilus assembly protein TadE [Chloroflexi bacterium]|nr:MAG: pilus assembly protein TadE [Chloroflexota bacterium]
MSRCYRHEHGQDIVEYALVLPLFLILTLGIIEFSMVILSYNTIANAAREGARVGIIPPGEDCDEGCRDAAAEAAARALTIGLNVDALEVTVTRSGGDIIQVQVDYVASLITGPMIAAWGGDGTIPLQTVATMTLE